MSSLIKKNVYPRAKSVREKLLGSVRAMTFIGVCPASDPENIAVETSDVGCCPVNIDIIIIVLVAQQLLRTSDR